MHIVRYLSPEHILLDLQAGRRDTIDPEKDPEKERRRLKEEVIEEIACLFDRTGVIRNLSKFRKDLLLRERSCSTAVGRGIAIPHVRSMQPRSLAIVFARSLVGAEYDAPDDQPVHIFFGITAPTYDDAPFLPIYKWIAQCFLQEEWLLSALLEAPDEHEIIKILSSLH